MATVVTVKMHHSHDGCPKGTMGHRKGNPEVPDSVTPSEIDAPTSIGGTMPLDELAAESPGTQVAAAVSGVRRSKVWRDSTMAKGMLTAYKQSKAAK